MNNYLSEICSILPELNDISHIKHLNSGYSDDHKYKVVTNLGLCYLLRLTDGAKASQKQIELLALTELLRLGVKCSKPIANGLTADEKYHYSLLSWIPGQDASVALIGLEPELQKGIGCDAGSDLRKMHLLPAPANTLPWNQLFKKKWYLNRDIYFQDSLRINRDSYILDFIEDHLTLISERPSTFQHDDFHLDNIIVKDNCYAGTIDFNRSSYGDPWHDFAKMFFYSSQLSPSFCQGQLQGYFDSQSVPVLFWEITSMYTAVLMINTVIWTKKASPLHLRQMLERINKVMQDYRSFSIYQPLWY